MKETESNIDFIYHSEVADKWTITFEQTTDTQYVYRVYSFNGIFDVSLSKLQPGKETQMRKSLKMARLVAL